MAIFFTMSEFDGELREGKVLLSHGKQSVIFTLTLEWYNFSSHGLLNVVTAKKFRH